jgi:hypothetical protein
MLLESEVIISEGVTNGFLSGCRVMAEMASRRRYQITLNARFGIVATSVFFTLSALRADLRASP